MAKLYFRVEAEYQKVIKLREECVKLEEQLKRMNSSSSQSYIKRLEKELADARAELARMTSEAATAGARIERDFKNKVKKTAESVDNLTATFKKAIGVIGGTAALKQLASQIVRVRGEFQDMETSIETIVGKNTAAKLIPQIKELAKISPLTMSDMVGAEKMMLGFNIAAEDTIKYLKAMSDLSMGSGAKFNSLTLAFSQMSATGKLMGQDLNQMINAGFNPLQEIARKTGKSIAELKEEMSKGAVSAKMVQDAFVSATEAGGKFYKMSENASKTINGQLSMLEDATDAAFNEMGKSSEEFIMKAISGTTTLVENYEKVGKVLLTLIATYGTYKTALLAVMAAEKAGAVARLASIKHISTLSAAIGILTKKVAALNLVTKMNPYAAALAAVVALVGTMWALSDSTTAAERAQNRYNKAIDEFNKKEEDRKAKIEGLVRTIQDKNETEFAQVKAYEELKRLSPALASAYSREELAVANLSDAYKEMNKERDAHERKNIESNIANLKDSIKKINSELSTLYQMGGGNNQRLQYLRKELGDSKEELKKWESELQKYNDLKKQAEEESKPIETKIIEAKADLEQIEKEFQKAKKKLEEEQKKVAENPLYTIPIWVQTQFDQKKSAYESQDSKVKGLEAQQAAQKPDFYGEAYKKAKEVWEDAKKAFENIEKDRDKFTVEQYKKAKETLANAESSFKALGGDISRKNVENAKKAAQRERELKERLHEEALLLQQNNQAEEIALLEEGTEKKLQQIEHDYKVRKAEISKQEAKWKKANKEAGKGNSLDEEQQKAIDSAIEVNENKRIKAKVDVYKEESLAMREYLKEYGSLMQQKLAIDEEYEEKKRKAQTEGERKTLEKQRKEELSNAEVADMLNKVDWASAFSDLGLAFKGQLQPIMEELKAFQKSEKFKELNASDQKAIIDAYQRIRTTIGDETQWTDLSSAMGEYQRSMKELTDANERELYLKGQLLKAENALENAKLNGGDVQYFQSIVDMLKQQLGQAGEAAVEAANKVNKSGTKLSSTAEAVINPVSETTTWLKESGIPQLGELSAAFDRLKGGINALKAIKEAGEDIKNSGQTIAEGAADGAKKASELIPKEMAENLSKAGAIAQIISAVLSILDILKEGIGTLVASIIDSVLNAVDGILTDILSGDIVKKILESVVMGVGSILKHLAEGLVDFFTFGNLSINWTGSNAKEVQATIDRLTDRNESLQTSIEDLTDEIKASKGAKSVNAYEMAYKNQQEVNKNYLDIAKAQASYHNHHNSWNKYWEGFSEEQMRWIKANVNADFNGDLFSLSPEEMKKLRANVEIWERIQNTGKGGYGDRLAEKLDDYIDQEGKLEELTNQLYEGLTGISFDGMYDSFINNLMDMEYSAEDAAEQISEYFMKAMLSNQIGEMYYEKLKGWWEKFGKAMENGSLEDIEENGKSERENLNDEYQSYVEEAIKIRDSVASATGYDKNNPYKQEASSKGFNAMSQEMGEELSGRFTAMYESDLRRESILAEQLEIMKSRTPITQVKGDISNSDSVGIQNIADDTRNILASSYLELQQIRENTGAIIKPIKQMQLDIAEVKRNTEKL